MHKPYFRLALMALLSFATMYVLMYAMVNSRGNVIANYNQFYMAGLMTIPMIIIEMILMKMMYPNAIWNSIILASVSILFVIFWLFIRNQTFISDKQFLKSMIPHHAGAILMCERANLKDPDIQKLCQNIISGQQTEIDQMKAKLKELR